MDVRKFGSFSNTSLFQKTVAVLTYCYLPTPFKRWQLMLISFNYCRWEMDLS